MRKNVLKCIAGSAIFIITMVSCNEEIKKYHINGKISDRDDGVVYLKRYEDKSFLTIDSAVVTNGTFTFEGITAEPLAYGLTTFKESNQPLVFFLDNGKINVQLNESEKIIKVDGSPVNDIYLRNATLVRKNHFNIDSLITTHPTSAVSAYFLIKDFTWRLNLKELKELRNKLDPSLTGSYYVNQIDTIIGKWEKLQVGSIAPDFTLPDVNGNPVSLSFFRGKYVLVDFWASWCPDCRIENPTLVATYEKYKDRNFTVFGVSLDRSRDAWLKAIDTDGLVWTHVSDLNGWNSEVAVQYAIRWIPTGYLIDPDGIIIATGTKLEDIIKKLDEILL